MENNIIVLSIILIFAMCSFIFEWMRIEVTALAVAGMILLVDVIAVQALNYREGFLLSNHNDIFAGFANSAVIAIGAMFVLSRALVKTGFLVVFADFMHKWVGRWKWFSIFSVLLIVSLLSGLINNTAVVAIFIPFIIIDMVVASILMSMGMMMLPQIIIAIPFKIIFLFR